MLFQLFGPVLFSAHVYGCSQLAGTSLADLYQLMPRHQMVQRKRKENVVLHQKTMVVHVMSVVMEKDKPIENLMTLYQSWNTTLISLINVKSRLPIYPYYHMYLQINWYNPNSWILLRIIFFKILSTLELIIPWLCKTYLSTLSSLLLYLVVLGF